METLKNCPNCGGLLEDSGRCRYCGSKIYDFLSVDFDGNKPTYVRIRTRDGKIATMPIIIHECSLTSSPIYADFKTDEGVTLRMASDNDTTMSMEARVVGEIIYEESEE